MGLAIDEAALLADTSPFCRFAESGICELLVDYLGSRLYLTTQVIGELEHRAAQAAHAQLGALAERRPPWVANPAVRLSTEELKRADALAHGWRRLQERQRGEVSGADAAQFARALASVKEMTAARCGIEGSLTGG